MTEPSKNIVIFGGSTVARELRARLPDSHLLILISEESYLTFNPLLPEVVGASIFPEQVVAPLRQMLNLSGASRFIMGHVVAIDRAAKTVTCSLLAGETVVPYSELILAFGNRPRLDLWGNAEMCGFWVPAQPVDATQALNLSAGVSNCKVSRGRSFS